MADPNPGDIAKTAAADGIPSGVTKVLGTLGDIAGVVANVFGAFQAGEAVLQLFGVGAPDPNQQYFLQIENQLSQIQQQIGNLQQKLDQVFSTLEGEILGAANENVRIQCSNALADSRTAAIEVLTYVKNQQDPQQMAGFNDAMSRSLSAVQKLTPEGMWVQVNSARSFYGDAYNGTKYPPGVNPASKTTFDYRFALPAYLEAVMNRIVVLSAADKTYRDEARTEVKQYADTLVAMHNKIVGGFEYLRVPILTELRAVIAAVDLNGYLKSSSDWQKTPNSPGWLQGGRLYGAVDTITGNAVTVPFSQFQLFGMCCATRVPAATNPQLKVFNLQTEMTHLYTKVQLASYGLGLQLYAGSGMGKVWQTAGKLYASLGLPAPAPGAVQARFMGLSLQYAFALCPAPHPTDLQGLEREVPMWWVTLTSGTTVSLRPSPPEITLDQLVAPLPHFQPQPAPGSKLYPPTEPS